MIIQRWQSVLLLIVGILLAYISFSFTDTWYVNCISLIAALLSIVTIFLYKKPLVQRKLCTIIMLIVIILMATSWNVGILPESISMTTSSVVSIVLLFISSRLIKKDYDKIKSIDRIR